MGAFRQNLVRLIRYFVLRPAAFFGWLAGLLVLVAAILLIPFFAVHSGRQPTPPAERTQLH